MFFDLRVQSTAPGPAMVKQLSELGYGGCAWDHTISTPQELQKLESSKKPSTSREHLSQKSFFASKSSSFREFHRLTLVLQDANQNYQLSTSAVYSHWDIVAIQPLTEKAFLFACSNPDIDLISLDMSERLPFYIKPPQIQLALSKGIYFEISYSKAITDTTARKNLIQNAASLLRFTKGKHVILSSGAQKALELRGPYDVINLSTLFNMNPDKAKACLTKHAKSLLLHAGTLTISVLREKNPESSSNGTLASRRHSHKGAVSVEPLDKDSKTEGKIRKAEDNVDKPEDGTDTTKQHQSKKQKLNK